MSALRNIEATPEQIAAALDPLRDYPGAVLAAFTERLRDEFPLDLPGGQIAADLAIVLERLVALRPAELRALRAVARPPDGR